MKKYFLLICMLLAVTLVVCLLRPLGSSVLNKNSPDNDEQTSATDDNNKKPTGGNNSNNGNGGSIDDGDPVYETICAYCDTVYDTREHSACPNENCPSREQNNNGSESTWQTCAVCGSGVLSEGSGLCTNPDCRSNGGNMGLVTCPKCGELYNSDTYSSCPNEECSSGSSGSSGEGWSYCPDCGTVMGETTCPNPDCVSNGGDEGWVTCPDCGEGYNTDTHQSCPNENCPSNSSSGEGWSYCPDCGTVRGETTCPNPNCVSNGGDEGLVTCPDCGEKYNSVTYQSCPNESCPSNSSSGEEVIKYCPVCGGVVGEASPCPNGCDDKCPYCGSATYGPNGGLCIDCDGTCSVCSEGYIQKSDGKCSNVNCSTNSSSGGNVYGTCATCDAALLEGGTCSNEECSSRQPGNDYVVEEGWLFKDVYFNSNFRTDLPAPIVGVSYTVFVDGEEIGTCVAEGNITYCSLWFNTNDYRVSFVYYSDMGWYFHPVDSDVQSGTVSVRINSGGSTNVQYCPICGESMGEASKCPNCGDTCPYCRTEATYNGVECTHCYGDCPNCSEGYLVDIAGHCSNSACSSYNTGNNYGTCSVCGASLQEGGTCSNDDCSRS